MTTEREVVRNTQVARLPSNDEATEIGLARLEQAILEQRAASDERLAILTDAVAAVRTAMLDKPDSAERVARLEMELAAREQRIAEMEATSHEQITALSASLTAIEESALWRLTRPIRRLEAKLPPATRARLFRLARRAYWLMTPGRMPMRRNWVAYAPQHEMVVKRLGDISTEVRHRLKPLRRAYGPSASEQMDIYLAAEPNAPIFVFIHGGAWRMTEAKNAAFAAETFVDAGVHYVVPDFIGVREAGGDLRVIAEQVRRSIAWVYRNAAEIGGDPNRLYLGGHSSGGHLCAVALTTDWQQEFGLPNDVAKAAVLMSGVYDVGAVRTARPYPYVTFTDEIEDAMSPARHVDRITVPVTVTVGASEAPEFRRQAQGFFATLEAAGKPARFIDAPYFGHMEMAESLGTPYGPNGRAVLAMMGL